jgi:hypothetical protein
VVATITVPSRPAQITATSEPQTLIHLDSALHEIAHADVTPTTRPFRTFLAAWWVAVGEGAVWVAHPNQDVVTRTDPA